MAKVGQFLMDKAKASAAKMTKEFGDDVVGGTKWLESKMSRSEEQLERDAEISRENYARMKQNTHKGALPALEDTVQQKSEYSQQLENAMNETVAALSPQVKPTMGIVQTGTPYTPQSAAPAPVVNGPSTSPTQFYVETEEMRRKREEEAAKATAEAIEARRKLQEQQAADQAIMERDLAELAKWPEADRRALETYATTRAGSLDSFADAMAGAVTGSNVGTRSAKAYEIFTQLSEKYGSEQVKNIAETWTRAQNEEFTKSVQEDAAGAVAGKFWAGTGHSLATIPANLVGAISSPLGVLSDAATRTGRYSTLDPNNAGNILNVYSGAVRGQVAQDIAGDEYDEDGNKVKDGGLIRKGLSYAYQGLMSAADSIARVATVGGTGSLALAATSSFGQTASEASRQGATPAQAVILATGSAALEVATEKIPLDEMLSAAKGGIKSAKEIALEALKQAGIEATTEEISLFGGILLEAAVLQDKSSYRQQIGEAIANGASYEDAKAQADLAVYNEAMETAAVSGLSGFISGDASAIFGNFAAKSDPNATVEATQKNPAEAAPAAHAATNADNAQTEPQQAHSTLDAVLAKVKSSDTGASNAMAEAVLNDPDAMNRLMQQTLEDISGTKSERRKAVKNALNQLAGQEQTQAFLEDTGAELAKNAPMPEPKTQQQIAADRTAAAMLGMEAQEAVSEPEGVGLLADLNDKQNSQTVPGNSGTRVFNVDNDQVQTYNNSNGTQGGMNDAGTQYQNGQQNDGAGSTGNPAAGLAGVQQDNGKAAEGRPQYGGVAGDAGIVRVSDKLQEAQRKRGTQTYPVLDTTGNPDSYEQALIAGRNSDQKNGWCVTQKSAQELRDGNVRTFMNESGTVGVGVAPDGDIVAVFKNRNGGPRKALDTLMPIAIEQGGDRLDCYGDGLVDVYAKYGFVPVARVEFNAEYANDGWTPEKGEPHIYVMMHNGDSADQVVSKMGTYPEYSDEQLNALPTYGKDDYDSAMAYRDSLMNQKRTQQADTQNQSSAGGQSIPDGMRGTGAAEANFSGKAEYQDLLTDDNTQRDRADDVRPMEVPKKDAYGRNVSEFVGNAYGAEATPDRMASEIESLVQEGALGFDRRSNKQSLENARQYIYGKDGTKGAGEAKTRNEITRNIANGRIQDGDIEKAMLLYVKYANGKSTSSQESAAELMVDLATMANMSGRNLQLFKLLRRMTPEGQLMTVQKTVQRNVENLQKSGKVKRDYQPDIDQELMQDYLDAAKECADADTPQAKKEAEERRKRVEDSIYVAEAAKMPATFKAKWDAWRYMCMLGNVKTQVRNVVGNAAFAPYKYVKDKMGALFEKAIPKEQRTKSLTTDRELLEWAREDAKSDSVKNALQYSAKLGDDVTSAQFAENRKVFDTKALEIVRKFVEKVPQAGDMLFKNGYYEKSLAGFLRARGYNLDSIKSGNVSDAVMAEARGYAIQEAMKATFNDCNAFSDAVASIGRKNTDNPWGKALNIAAEGILPFRRTPANIVVRFAEYSPAGLAKGAWDMAAKVRNGDLSASAAIDQISAGLTGTAVMTLGYFLAKGIGGVRITGGGISDDEKRQGHQEYALEFSYDGQLYSYKIDWAAPANLPLFVGANVYQLMENAGAETDVSIFTSILHGLGNAFEPMLALSCLSSLNDLVDGIRYAPEGEALYTIASDIATSYFTQGIPTLARQTYQATQEYKQSTFANSSDPTIREMQRAAASIPFAGAAFQTDKINAWGEKEETGTELGRAVNAFINPGTLKRINNSAVEQEITRLNEAQAVNVSPPYADKKISYTGTDGTKHNGMRLTEEQYTTLATVQGQTAAKLLADIITSAEYKALTDDQKAATISAVYEYAQEQGKKAAIDDYYSNAASWVQNSTGGVNDFISRGALSPLQRAVESTVNALSNGWEVTDAAISEMDESYDSYSSMSRRAKQAILDNAVGDTLKYLQVRSQGVSTEKYLEAKEQISGLTPEEGNKSVSDAQKAEAIAGISGLSEAHRTALVKMEVSDAQDENIDQIKDLGYSVADYAKLYRDYKDYTSGKGKKDRTIEKWMQDYEISHEAAKALYEVFSSTK